MIWLKIRDIAAESLDSLIGSLKLAPDEILRATGFQKSPPLPAGIRIAPHVPGYCLRLFSQLQSPVVGERLFYMVANQKIVAAINDQMGNEFSAMLQYYAIAAHFGAEGLRELSAHFYKQAEEEKEHALRFIQFVIDTGARVKIPAVSAPQAHFELAEDAVKLSLEQEEQVTTQINALVSMAKAESDYTADNFLQWFIKEQLEEVASMGQLLRVVQRAGEGNLLRVEEYLAREKHGGAVLSEEK
jgi:bacterioferritin B